MTETEALIKYDAFLWRQVHRFFRFTRNQTIQYDDLIQEARLAFLQHIRTHDESMWMACTLTIKRALFECVRKSYPLTVSHDRFAKLLREQISFITVECCAEVDDFMYEDDHSVIDLQSFLEELSEEERRLVSMRLEGMKFTQIGKRANISYWATRYRFKTIRKKISL